MVRAKPDCAGQKFGRLTVLGKGGRLAVPTKSPKYRNGTTSIQLWVCQCDCGVIVEKPRGFFDTSNKTNPSCGCFHRESARKKAEARSKPDCTGQRFGMLTVVGKGEIVRANGRSRRLWNLICDCGNTVSLPRGSFDGMKSKQKSCGCLGKERRKELVDNKRRPEDISGQRFGSLTVLRLSGENQVYGKWSKPLWECQCDCGNVVKMTHSRLDSGYRLNCDDRTKHEWGLWYPPAPIPYPAEAWRLVEKYLKYTQPMHHWNVVDQEVQDEKRDRLIRICWILVYRRQQGEEISDLKERRYIMKSLRHIGTQVYWKRKLEQRGGLAYNIHGIKREIGGVMTDRTLQNYPVAEAETLGNKILSKPPKRIKFRRC